MKIRVDFNEPRIILPSGGSRCPKLRSEAYQANHSDEQLENQTRLFLSDRDKNGVTKRSIYLKSSNGTDDFNDVQRYLNDYASYLTDSVTRQKSLKSSTLPIRYRL